MDLSAPVRPNPGFSGLSRCASTRFTSLFTSGPCRVIEQVPTLEDRNDCSWRSAVYRVHERQKIELRQGCRHSAAPLHSYADDRRSKSSFRSHHARVVSHRNVPVTCISTRPNRTFGTQRANDGAGPNRPLFWSRGVGLAIHGRRSGRRALFAELHPIGGTGHGCHGSGAGPSTEVYQEPQHLRAIEEPLYLV